MSFHITYVDSAAVGSADGQSWANAFPTLQQATQSWVTADIIFVETNHNQNNGSNSWLITGPAGNNQQVRVPIMRVNKNTGAYDPSPADGSDVPNLETTGGAAVIRFNFHAAVYGLRIRSGSDFDITTSYTQLWEDCHMQFGVADNTREFDLDNGLKGAFVNCKIDSPGGTSATIAVNNLAVGNFKFCNFDGFMNGAAGMVSGDTGSFVRMVFDSCRLYTLNETTIIDTSNLYHATSKRAQFFEFNYCQLGAGYQLANTVQNNRLSVVTAQSSVDINSLLTTVIIENRRHNQDVKATNGLPFTDPGAAVDFQGHSATVDMYTSKGLVTYPEPITSPKFGGWFSTGGTATITVELEDLDGTLTDVDVWMEVTYRADAATSVSVIDDSTKGLPGTAGTLLAAGAGDASWQSGGGRSAKLSLGITVAIAGAYSVQVFCAKPLLNANRLRVNPRAIIS